MSGKISRGLNDCVPALLAFGGTGGILGRDSSTAAAKDPDDSEAPDVPVPALLEIAPKRDEDAPPSECFGNEVSSSRTKEALFEITGALAFEITGAFALEINGALALGIDGGSLGLALAATGCSISPEVTPSSSEEDSTSQMVEP